MLGTAWQVIIISERNMALPFPPDGVSYPGRVKSFGKEFFVQIVA
jgi:hypothetical protein